MGLVACEVIGVVPVRAESVPVIVVPMPPIVITGLPGDHDVHSRSGVTWATSGRADVDIDVDQQHGQTVMR
jgi:hypothetical protein